MLKGGSCSEAFERNREKLASLSYERVARFFENMLTRAVLVDARPHMRRRLAHERGLAISIGVQHEMICCKMRQHELHVHRTYHMSWSRLLLNGRFPTFYRGNNNADSPWPTMCRHGRHQAMLGPSTLPKVGSWRHGTAESRSSTSGVVRRAKVNIQPVAYLFMNSGEIDRLGDLLGHESTVYATDGPRQPRMRS